MTESEILQQAYPGTHIAFQGDLPVWSLCMVDLERRTAYVVNGNYQIEWDDTDMYFRHDHRDKLNWMFELGPEFRIEKVGDVWLDQKRKLKQASPDGAENEDCSA